MKDWTGNKKSAFTTIGAAGHANIGYEITKEYFDIAQERIKQEQSQLTLF